MKDLRFYYINDQYIDYLSKHQNYIWNNDYDGVKRPYIGVLIRINEFNYYAPLSSYKDNRSGRTSERIDLKIIKSGDRKLAFLQINNMIPVDDTLVTLVDVHAQEENYRNLLHAEIADLRPRQASINKDANRVYNLTTKYKDDENNKNLVKRCYDFKHLEKKLSDFLNGER